MKAVRVHEFGDPEVMRIEEVQDPQPGIGQLLITVRAIGVNPVDAYIRSGLYPLKPSLPYTPGLDAAGLVEAVGGEVGGIAVNDRVYVAGTISGAYAEKALCTASEVHPLPGQITFSQGAAVGVPYATAYRALFIRARALPGEVVLIHGASGGVGIAAVQIALAAGMTVIGTAGTEQGERLVAEQGAHHVVNHHAPNHLEEVAAFTGGRGVDVVLEMLANVNLGRDLSTLARGGRIVVIGSRGTVEINPRDAMSRDASIQGLSLFNTPEPEMKSIHAALAAGLANGTLRPVVSREMTLSDAPRAHHAVLEGSTFGKIVLLP
ncbi:MAG TPA: NADPH:quinone reductase [Thermodesulfovibrionales bacterium]|jgi:NADPH2:quinone reductase|nr:NADPH:quinone reductase [Thermodesulfovibrionales bacterium]